MSFEDPSFVPFKLRFLLKGHSDDVRAIVVDGGPPTRIFTGSRDATIKVWEDDLSVIREASTLVGHSDFVVALAGMPPGSNTMVPGVGLVSGSRDKSAIVWDVESTASAALLAGHEQQVNAVALLPGGEVATGSLDGILKVWKAGRCLRTVHVHEGAVLCLLALSNGDILTGSGDKTIKQWSGGISVATFTGHSDSVRCLCDLPGLGFVSGSHDGTLRAWALSGTCLTEFVGHTALVYSCTALPSGQIVSGSEDNTARVWNAAGDVLQVLEHPGCVWSVAVTPEGDVVAGTSDHNAYVWTTAPSRHASKEVIAAYDALLLERKAGASEGRPEASVIPEDQIKPDSALLMPGQTDNETIIVRQDGVLWAYVWSSSACEWSNLGEVTSRPADNLEAPKKWHEGAEWDFVFDVDASDSAPPLRLPMNRGEDPYDVAERFMLKHMLPAAYRERIVDFILQNTQGPAGPSQPAEHRTTQPPSAEHSGSGLVYTPHREYQHFEAGFNAGKVASKAQGLSREVSLELQLSEDECSPGGALDYALQIALSQTGSLGDVFGVLGKLAKWPAPQLLPVLDIFRLVVLQSTSARLLAADAGALEASNPGLGGIVARGLSLAAPSAARVVALRLVCNCFKHAPLRSWLLGHWAALVDALAELCPTDVKAGRAALATVLLNLGVALQRGDIPDGGDVRIRMLSMLNEIIASCQIDDEDALFRAFLAATTSADGNEEAKTMGEDLGFAEQAKHRANAPVSTEQLAIVLGDAQKLFA